LELIKFKISTPSILPLLGMLKFLDLPFISLVTLILFLFTLKFTLRSCESS